MLNQYYSKEEYQLKCILGILKDLKKSKIDYKALVEALNEQNNRI